MGPVASAVIPGLVTGGLSLFGQQSANAANARMAREQMAFQERMRSTQYQTQVEDLRKAGLNPALAYGAGGAGTPVGAKAEYQNVAGGAAQNAVAMMGNIAHLTKTAAETDLLHKQGSGQDLQNQILTYKWMSDILGYEVTKATWPALVEKLKAEARSAVTGAQQAETTLGLDKLKFPEARAMAQFYESMFGKGSPFLNSAGKAMIGISQLGRLFRR